MHRISRSPLRWISILLICSLPGAITFIIPSCRFSGRHRIVQNLETCNIVSTRNTYRRTFTCLSASVAPHQPLKRSSKSRRNAQQRHYIRTLFQKAKDLERKGQWRKAAAILRDILVLDPTDSHSHLALARLEARRKTNKAVEVFQNGTSNCPDSIHLWQAWAVYEESTGHVDKARELFQKALTIDECNPYACHAFGLMEYRLGNVQKARELWEYALERTSTAALVCSLGELLISNEAVAEAAKLYATHVMTVKSEREKNEIYLAHAWLEERYFENFDRAEELIQLSLTFSPSSSKSQVALARLEGRRREKQQGEEGNTATARRLASTCIGIENGSADFVPTDGRVYNAWANMEVKSKRFAAAKRILEKGIKRYPNDHSLMQAAGKVEERMGNYSSARELYSASLRIQPSAPTLVAYAMLELRYPESGTMDLQRIKRLFEEALLLDDRHGPAYNAYARIVFEYMKDENEARSIFERGVKANCADAASIYHGYARLELSLGNISRARKLLLEGTRAAQRQDIGKDSPHRERATFLTHTLGMLELNSNRPAKALKVFLDGIERFGNSSQLLLGAALCEVRLGNDDKARLLFERSVTNDEKHAHAWQAWGVMEMRAGNMKTAKTLFECGIKSCPRHGALWQAFATMESRLGNVDAARTLFRKGIKNSPKHVPLYQSWASMELREGEFVAAKALISEALTRDKRNGSGWLVAAEIEKQSGNIGLATLLLRRGIECSPTSAELYNGLGELLVRDSKINEARQVFEKGMDVDPLYAPLYHSLAELEARIFNIEGLSKLNKRAAALFNSNALAPSKSSPEVLGSRIRAKRSREVPKGIAALAERIVDDELVDFEPDAADRPAFLDGPTLTVFEEGLVRSLLNVDDPT